MHALNFPQANPHQHFYIAQICKQLSSGRFEVLLPEHNKTVNAQRCASCLLEPMPGDEVILLNINHHFYLTAVIAQKNPDEQLLTATKLTLKSQELHIKTQKGQVQFTELKMQAKRLWAKIPFLEATGGQWLSVIKKTFFKSTETVHDLGHYVLDTESMHEAHASLKTLKTPLMSEKTETHHISTEKFLLD